MSKQSTYPGWPSTIGEQRPAIDALAAMADMFGHLPPGFITIRAAAPDGIDLQLDSPQDFEAWRVALQVPPSTATWHVFSGSVWIAAEAQFRGVRVALSGYNVPVALAVAKVSPAEDAERRYRAAQLAEQHHQADDPTVPDLAAYIAVIA